MRGWSSWHHDEQWPGGYFHCCGMKNGMKWRARKLDMVRFRRGMGVFESNKLWLQCVLTFKKVRKRFRECIWYMDDVMDDILWIFGWKIKGQMRVKKIKSDTSSNSVNISTLSFSCVSLNSPYLICLETSLVWGSDVHWGERESEMNKNNFLPYLWPKTQVSKNENSHQVHEVPLHA